MSDLAAQDEPQPVFEDSRRLTGPNRWFSGTAVVLTPLGAAVADPAALARWRQRVSEACTALGWPDPQPLVHQRPGSVTLVFAAPPAALFTATELNEWAWEFTAAEEQDLAAAGFTRLHDLDAVAACRRLRALAKDEASPPLQRLVDAATARGVVAIVDDDSLSLGHGEGSACWPRAALPLPLDVPWTRLHSVPTVLVTGSNGKTTTTRLLAAMFAATGRVPGLCSTEGVLVGGQRRATGDYAGPAGARAVLRDRAVQAAVLETARGGLLRRGLAVDHAEVAVVTNVSADHLGEYGITGVDDIADVKLTLARVLGLTGTLVINAGDEVLMQAASRLAHVRAVPQAWFALDDGHPRLQAHRDRLGTTCGVQGGQLRLSVGGHPHSLGEVASMPLALGGAAAYNLENIAAAALAAHAVGLPLPIIAATLASFGAMPADNPGRLERWPYRGATVLVDYAHNPDGLQQLLRVARALKPARLGLLLGQAGNRGDAAIGELAAVAASFTPDQVVIKELPTMLRGRTLGEVPRLLRAALSAAGLSDAALDDQADEFEAATALLGWARPGDVIVLPIHTDAVRQGLAALLASA